MLKLREIASIWFKVTASGPYIDTAFTTQSTSHRYCTWNIHCAVHKINKVQVTASGPHIDTAFTIDLKRIQY